MQANYGRSNIDSMALHKIPSVLVYDRSNRLGISQAKLFSPALCNAGDLRCNMMKVLLIIHFVEVNVDLVSS